MQLLVRALPRSAGAVVRMHVCALSHSARHFVAAPPLDDSKNHVPIVVQKFGGTSLGTPEKLEKVLNIVGKWHRDNRVACVVSALSSHTKAEGTTTRLLNAAENAVHQEPFHQFLDAIEDTHLDVVYTMLRKHENREIVKQHISKELRMVRRFCESLTVIRELSPRSHDMIVGCGERLSAGLIAGVLRENDIPAAYVNLSNLFRDPLDASKTGYHRLATAAIRSFLDREVDVDGVVPVITGYMGDIEGGIVQGIGRGYSDLTAALVAAALRADALQVWKESDGIFTGNPTKINAARLLHNVTPREAAELTYFGNEVLHPFTMECAIEAQIPIHILNTFKIDSPGTVVAPGQPFHRMQSNGVTAVVSKKNVRVISLASNRMMSSPKFLARVFEAFGNRGVKIDLISTAETNLSIAIHESVPDADAEALLQDLEKVGECTMVDGRALVAIIGEGMKNQIGVAARMFRCLSDAGVNFEMITQGASEINVSVIINAADADKAIAEIHAEFLEGSEAEELEELADPAN
ncbi:uncharacterized protein MONBRDRAFT_22547 [Monosiga brevicollis MX1]|uniref:Aspartokinase n=1 Tax=Monosiga brevicollis TaxID=81824 RepID=A9UQW7_MONBE|nr:uncharacterized protein MONBRDRAFT_22547 [Monosiga brevicollis MX1]EDQ92671.1 predicted protein [Monosiga brevicollis MX1]|eukprot:XP_001742433.1 hypothetical protein [Monosiga brevicollis MX1]